MVSGPLGAGIPFNRPSIEGDELNLMLAAVDNGHVSAGGAFSAQVVDLLKGELGSADVLLTTSCTDALEMAALLLDLGPDDVVIVPSFAFVSTALAFARTGARIRFADIEPETLGLDPAYVAVAYSMIGSRRSCRSTTRASVVISKASRPCSANSNAAIVEDNAHGLFGRYRERPLGSFGRSPRSASTRRRTSSAARAERSS